MSTAIVETVRRLAAFDRKARFSDTSSWPLSALRTCGRVRRGYYSIPHPQGCKDYHHERCNCSSASLKALQLHKQKRGIYVDLGCGDSADTAIARYQDHYSFGVDLQPPSNYPASFSKKPGLFYKADMVEGLPFGDNFIDYASCHAVIALMTEQERQFFYENVFAALKRNGLFSFYICPLVEGHPFKTTLEIKRMQSIGFRFLKKGAHPLAFKP